LALAVLLIFRWNELPRENRMSLTRALGYLALAAVAVGVIANINDIRRYIRISTM
jgi:hypothetical protein